MSDYLKEAREDAKNMALHFLDEIIDGLLDDSEASSDLFNSYPGGDSYHHENHVDKWYELHEAADVLDVLSEYEETDTGLWEGLEPKRAVGCMAAFTYGNAVTQLWMEIIDQVNSDDYVSDLIYKVNEIESDDENSEDDKEKSRELLENRVREIIKFSF